MNKHITKNVFNGDQHLCQCVFILELCGFNFSSSVCVSTIYAQYAFQTSIIGLTNDVFLNEYLSQGNKMYIKLNKGKCSGNIKIEILNIMLKKMCADLMVKLIHLKTTKPSRTEEVFIASLCKIVNSFFSIRYIATHEFVQIRKRYKCSWC